MSVYCDSIEFVTITCYSCKMPFGMSRAFYDARRKDHKDFSCPAGHEQHFTGKSDEEKLREEVQRREEMLNAERARAARLERQRNDVKETP